MVKESARFKMTKKHHLKTFQKALKEGKVDKDFVSLCRYISKTKNYFTTSCCAGRIVLVGLDKEETKKESAFYRKWHRKVKEKEVLEAVKNFRGDVLWFKQEPIILHLGANSFENAQKILAVCEKSGIKRAGIKVAKEGKYIVEMVGTHLIQTPIMEGGKKTASENYIKYLVKKANQKFLKNKHVLKRLEKEIRENLK